MEETQEDQQNLATLMGAQPARTPVRLLRQGKKQHSRKTDILKVLLKLLEDAKCDRITTALLAKQLGVSEAALYRSFPSKAAMFDELINYIEMPIMGTFGNIRQDPSMTNTKRIKTMVSVLLNFATENPGYMRVLTGQVLLKEDPCLSERVTHVIDKIEMSFRQTYRDAVLAEELPANFDTTGRANMLTCWVLGRIQRYVMTNFRVRPNDVSELEVEIFLAH